MRLLLLFLFIVTFSASSSNESEYGILEKSVIQTVDTIAVVYAVQAGRFDSKHIQVRIFHDYYKRTLVNLGGAKDVNDITIISWQNMRQHKYAAEAEEMKLWTLSPLEVYDPTGQTRRVFRYPSMMMANVPELQDRVSPNHWLNTCIRLPVFVVLENRPSVAVILKELAKIPDLVNMVCRKMLVTSMLKYPQHPWNLTKTTRPITCRTTIRLPAKILHPRAFGEKETFSDVLRLLIHGLPSYLAQYNPRLSFREALLQIFPTARIYKSSELFMSGLEPVRWIARPLEWKSTYRLFYIATYTQSLLQETIKKASISSNVKLLTPLLPATLDDACLIASREDPNHFMVMMFGNVLEDKFETFLGNKLFRRRLSVTVESPSLLEKDVMHALRSLPIDPSALYDLLDKDRQ